jgi:hypothetical protein
MDILELNARILSIKRDHIIHTIKYRKFIKKIISFMDLPEVIYKFIFNYVGSSPFPMNSYLKNIHTKPHPHFALKNIDISHQQDQEETNGLEQ